MLFVIKTKLKIVNIGFIQYDSKSLESVTAYAKNEKQSIVLSKNKIYHELQIDFGQLTETTGSNIEIQSYAIRISAIVVGSEFRLCWVNTKLCTVKLTMSSNENDFKLAINNVVQKESKIIIKLESISSANVLTISTITTSGTDIEKLTVVEIVMNTISFSITSNSINEKTKKTPFTYRFKFESSTGVYYTEEIEFNSFESIVQSKIYNALSPRCSHKIKNDETQSYDDDSSDEYESLCGKSFKKWAYNLRTDSIKPLSLKSNRYVCLGLRGFFSNTLAIKYYLDKKMKTFYWNDKIMETVSIKRWTYTCFDLRSILTNMQIELYTNVYVHSHKRTSSFRFMDEVSFVPEKIQFDVLTERNVPDILVSEVKVIKKDSLLTLKLFYYDCAPHPKISIITSLDVSIAPTIKEIAVPTSPLTGMVSLTFDSETVSIPVKSDANQLKRILSLNTKINTDEINIVVSSTKCYEKKWDITWVNNGGRKKLFSIGDKDNSIEKTEVIRVVEGKSEFEYIPGSFSQSCHKNPQISVRINKINILSKTNLDIIYDESLRPTVDSALPVEVTSETTVTIKGTNFDTTNNGQNNNVYLGDINCIVLSATSVEIQCKVTDGVSGNKNLFVEIKNKGEAKSMTLISLQYKVKFTNVDPNVGSLGGGTRIQINGSGYTSDMTKVQIHAGGKICKIETITTTKIICITSQNSASAATLEYIENDVTTNTNLVYTYNDKNTPKVSSLTKTSFTPDEDNRILDIDGTGFIDVQNVFVGGINCKIIYYTDTKLSIKVPILSDGNHNILISTAVGYALKSGALPKIMVDFKVKSVNFEKISALGGLEIQLTGTGFTTKMDKISVKIGQVDCKVFESTTTLIKCINGVQSQKEIVYFESGQIYLKKISLPIGSTLQFIGKLWNAIDIKLKYLIDNTLKVITIIQNEKEYDESTLLSSVEINSFTQAGEYTYTTDLNNLLNDFFAFGILTIIPLESKMDIIKLKINGIEAVYLNSFTLIENPTLTTCPVSLLSGCQNSDAFNKQWQDAQVNSKFYILHDKCLTSTLTSISTHKDTLSKYVEFKGENFPISDKCLSINLRNSKIKCACIIDNSSFTKTFAKCKIDVSCELSPFDPHYFEISVVNHGNLIISGDVTKILKFTIIPEVTSCLPISSGNSGSIGGSTLLIIKGSGLGVTASLLGKYPNIHLSINDVKCEDIIKHTSQEIHCLTPAMNSEIKNSVVKMLLYGRDVVIPTACTFSYLTEKSPTLNVITELFDSVNKIVTISGSTFGTTKSDINVFFNKIACDNIDSVTDTLIKCIQTSLPYGQIDTIIERKDYGKSIKIANFKKLFSTVVITPVVSGLTKGSLAGGKIIEFTGTGLDVSNAKILFYKTGVIEKECKIDATLSTYKKIVCFSSGVDKEYTDVPIIFAYTIDGINKQIDTGSTFSFLNAFTPSIDSIAPTIGNVGTKVVISGQLFDSDTVVKINTLPCTTLQFIGGKLNCVLPLNSYNKYSFEVFVPSLGYTTGVLTNMFTYEIKIDSISPNSGSLVGGTILKLVGIGLNDKVTFYVDDLACLKLVCSSDMTFCDCTTPPMKEKTTFLKTIYYEITKNKKISITDKFTYSSSLTPEITGVSPNVGGTAGGTSLIVSGSSFGQNIDDVTVQIGSIDCTIVSVKDSEITCLTKAVTVISMNFKSPILIKVYVKNKGFSTNKIGYFEYIDLWSSRYSWGGANLPIENDLVVITENQHIRLDINTPRFSMILIKGGKLSFADKDVELKSNNILITDGGILEIGTTTKPFQNRAIITLTGKLRSPELPIYGAKTLAIRNGSLELHGRKTPETWSLLANTLEIGGNVIVLKTKVNWKIGDKIVIPTTGGHNSQNENETFLIIKIELDEKTITLDTNAKFKHLGITETYSNGASIELRAEVGLLSHNILFRGSSNEQWADNIKACPETFDTGQFAVQTCFQGRFGNEVGSDEYGGQIMAHSHVFDSNSAKIHIEYVELFNVGQAFRIGRYPIHFHINGNMTGSYVKGCSIHKTYNRAINIHNSHNILLERNVIYDVMGGAVFLEDSIERENIIQYNLLVHVKSSSSLLNDDISPAGLWITHPYNIVRHNHIAGGTHFGIWYRMREHPEGPSFDKSICPRFAPLLECFNNTVHSVGWYGLWIFERYDPRETSKTYGKCDYGAATKPAIFEKMIVWNSLRGAEWVRCSSVQYKNFLVGNNFEANLEHVHIMHNTPQYKYTGAMVTGATIISHFNYQAHPPCSKYGTVLPFGNGLLYDGVTYINYDGEKNGQICSTFGLVKVICECTNICGGYTYKFKNVKYINSSKRSDFKWEHMMELVDLDGSLTDTNVAGYRVVPKTDLVPLSKCKIDTTGMWSVNFKALLCSPTVSMFRFSFNEALPESLLYKNIIVKNKNGESLVPYRIKRDVFSDGWMFMGVVGESYSIVWENGLQISNISYLGRIWNLEKNEFIFISHILKQDFYDILNVPLNKDPTVKNHNYTITSPLNNGGTPWDSGLIFGDYHYSKAGKELTYVGVCSPHDKDYCDLDVKFEAKKCFYYQCKLPGDGDEINEITITPNNSLQWSMTSSWSTTLVEDKIYCSSTTNGLPSNGAKIIIPKNLWVILDTGEKTVYQEIIIRGTLQVKNNLNGVASPKIELHVFNIIIQGGHMFAGTAQEAFTRDFDIVLHGNQDTVEYVTEYGPKIGSKSIAVFGLLQLFGSDKSFNKYKLVMSARKGDNSITVNGAITWKTKDEIVISSSSFDSGETEIVQIKSVDLKLGIINLETPLNYNHFIVNDRIVENSSSQSYEISVYVGLLTRNIKIFGYDDGTSHKQSFGGRVVVGRTTEVNLIDGIPDIKSFQGKIRIESVEFMQTGQEGFVSPSDPRFSIAFIDISNEEMSDNFVRFSSFRNCYSTAVGIFGSSNIKIEFNTIYHTVVSAIVTNSKTTLISGNLVLHNLFSGTYNGRYEPFNLNYDGAIHTVNSVDTQCIDNVVIGSERAAFNTGGELCTSSNAVQWHNNIIGAAVIGVLIEPENCQATTLPISDKCVRIRSFKIWKVWTYGIYTQSECNILLSDNILIDTKIGTFAMVLGGSPVNHILNKHYVTIERSVYVGMSKGFDCQNNNIEKSNKGFYVIATSSTPPKIGGEQSYHAILWPTTNENDNMFPEMALHTLMSRNLLSFDINVKDTVFVNYNKGCQNSKNYIFVYNPENKDYSYMIKTNKLKYFNVSENNIAQFGRPKLSNIKTFNGCIDMDCDMNKKLLIKDLDGSLLEHFYPKENRKYAIIPDSSFQWNGDQSRGFGDHRIPKTMSTDLNGNRIEYKHLYKKVGIQNNRCVWNEEWTAYRCQEDDYYHLHLESLDSDTLTRRIGPIAILSGDLFLDVMNGPSDHGICEGYACRERLSLYRPIITAGSNYTIHLSSTLPQNLRLMLPSSGATVFIFVAIYYSTSQRIDVTANGVYVPPSNRVEVSPGEYRYKTVDKPFYYISDGTSGANIYDTMSKTLYLTVQSSIDYKISIVAVVRFSFDLPDMTIDDFFGVDIINNLRIFLGLDPSQVRIVNIISESNALQKKRAIGKLSVQLEFGDNPGVKTPVLSFQKLTSIVSNLGEAIQSDSISKIMNAIVINMTITKPVPPPEDPNYQQYIITADQNVGHNIILETIVIPTSMKIFQNPIPLHAGAIFEKPLIVCIYDETNQPIQNLYSSTGLWSVELTLIDDDNNIIMNVQHNVRQVISGCATFTNFTIIQADNSKFYRLDAKVVGNSYFKHGIIQSKSFKIPKQPISANVLSMNVEQNVPFNFKIKIVDFITRKFLNVKNETWQIRLSPDYNCSNNNEINMVNSKNEKINKINLNVSNTSDISSIQLSESITILNSGGIFTFVSEITGSLDFYPLKSYATVYVNLKNEIVPDEKNFLTKNVTFKIDSTFDSLKNVDFEGFTLCVKTKFEQIGKDIIFSNFRILEGSIMIKMEISGTPLNIVDMIKSLKEILASQVEIKYSTFSAYLDTYLAIDGSVLQKSSMKSYLQTVLLSVLIPCLLIILIIIFILLAYFAKIKKDKLGRINVINLRNGMNSSREIRFSQFKV